MAAAATTMTTRPRLSMLTSTPCDYLEAQGNGLQLDVEEHYANAMTEEREDETDLEVRA